MKLLSMAKNLELQIVNVAGCSDARDSTCKCCRVQIKKLYSQAGFKRPFSSLANGVHASANNCKLTSVDFGLT